MSLCEHCSVLLVLLQGAANDDYCSGHSRASLTCQTPCDCMPPSTASACALLPGPGDRRSCLIECKLGRLIDAPLRQLMVPVKARHDATQAAPGPLMSQLWHVRPSAKHEACLIIIVNRKLLHSRVQPNPDIFQCYAFRQAWLALGKQV